MKKILTLCALSLAATAAFAVPAKPGQWKTIRLADGTELRAELKGDEWGSYWLAENGKAYNEEADKGFFVQVGAAAINANAQMMRAEMNSQRSATLKKTAANAKKGQAVHRAEEGSHHPCQLQEYHDTLQPGTHQGVLRQSGEHGELLRPRTGIYG